MRPNPQFLADLVTFTEEIRAVNVLVKPLSPVALTQALPRAKESRLNSILMLR